MSFTSRLRVVYVFFGEKGRKNGGSRDTGILGSNRCTKEIKDKGRGMTKERRQGMPSLQAAEIEINEIPKEGKKASFGAQNEFSSGKVCICQKKAVSLRAFSCARTEKLRK